MSYSDPLFWWCFALTAWIVFGIAWSWLLARAAGREEPKPWPERKSCTCRGYWTAPHTFIHAPSCPLWPALFGTERIKMPAHPASTTSGEIAPFRRVREEKRHE